MNANQSLSLINGVLKVLGTYLALYGYNSVAASLNTPELGGAVLVLVGFAGSLWHHAGSDKSSGPSGGGTGGGVGLLLAVGLVVAIGTGCTSIVNTPQGKILSVTERGIGFKVAQSAANQTPEVWFGFNSTAVVILPTSTNAQTYAPNYANSFDYAQSSAFALGIGEKIASGNYRMYEPGQSNSVVVAAPDRNTNSQAK